MRPDTTTMGRTAGLADRAAADLSFALRCLRRAPGFTVVALVSLTAGMSLAVLLFSLLNAVLFRSPSGVAAPEELVGIFAASPQEPVLPLSCTDAIEIGTQADALASVAAVQRVNALVRTRPDSERQVQGEQVSENYFSTLGTGMFLGRGFLTADADSDWRVAVVSHALWQNLMGGDTTVIGRAVEVNGLSFTLVGVAPPRFAGWRGTESYDVWIPVPADLRERRGHRAFQAIGRLRPGASIAQLEAQLQVVASRLATAHPLYWKTPGGTTQGLRAISLSDMRLSPASRTSLLAGTGVVSVVLGLLLLVVCTNIGGLQMGRALGRQREFAVRLALGVTRRRLAAMLLTESAVLGVTSAILALALTWWLAALLVQGGGPFTVATWLHILPDVRPHLAIGGAGWHTLPTWIDILPDWRVVAFAAALVLATTLASGLIPALQASRPDLVVVLKGESTGPFGHRFTWRHLLVSAQIAGTFVLVAAAGLMLRSYWKVQQIDLGHERRGVCYVEIDLSQRGLAKAQGAPLLDDLRARVSGLPGVLATALGETVPIGSITMAVGGLEPEGYQAENETVVMADFSVVSPGYFDVLRMPVVRGRAFDDRDRPGTPAVVMVNQAFADRYWPGQDAIGKRLALDSPATVVGVVRNATYRQPGEDPRPFVWYPLAQWYRPRVMVLARTSGNASELIVQLRETVFTLDRGIPVLAAGTLETLENEDATMRRLAPRALAGFAVACLGLAMLGIWGITEFSVGRRTREIGVRLALGASPGQVVTAVGFETLRLAAIGAGAGVVVFALLALAARSLIFGVIPLDPVAVAAGLAVIALATAAGSIVPARRALRVDPAQALRAE